jgi:hypothetical protein
VKKENFDAAQINATANLVRAIFAVFERGHPTRAALLQQLRLSARPVDAALPGDEAVKTLIDAN